MRSVTLICGPPCAGKSTLARQLAEETGGLVLDRDDISIRLGYGTGRVRPKNADQHAEAAFRAACERIAAAVDITAYIVRGLPRIRQRKELAMMLGATVKLLDPGVDECIRRAHAAGRPPVTVQWILQWYARASGAYIPYQHSG